MGKIIAIVALAVLALTSDVQAGSGIFKCQASESYQVGSNGKLDRDPPLASPPAEILFDVRTGRMVRKFLVGTKEVHKSQTFHVTGKGQPIDRETRMDVTAYYVIPEGGGSSVVWTFSIMFYGETTRALFVQRHSIWTGTCHEM